MGLSLGCYGLLEFRFLGNPQLSVIDVSSNLNEVPLVVLLPVDRNYQISVSETCGSIPVSSCSIYFQTVNSLGDKPIEFGILCSSVLSMCPYA